MENQLIISLSRNRLLKNVEISKIDLRNIRGKLITIGEGEILYREGDSSDGIFLVVSGEINLLKKRLLGKSKSFIFSEDEFFGQEEFIEETSRTSTAVALRDSYLIFLSKEEVNSLIKQDENILNNLREPVEEKNKEIKEAITEIVEPQNQILEESKYFDNKKDELSEQKKDEEFFQSISDSSRSGVENLVQPLDKIENEEQPFDNLIFNEDGIIKSEFELPEETTFEKIKEEQKEELLEPIIEKEITEEKISNEIINTSEVNLTEALFDVLNVSSSSVNQNIKEIKSDSPSIENDDFYSSITEIESEKILNEENVVEEKIIEKETFKNEIEEFQPVEQFDLQENIVEKKIVDTKNESKSKLTNDELEILLRAAELVNSTIKVEDVLQNIVTVAIQLTNADRGTLYLIDKDKNELWSLVLHANEIKEIRLKIGEGLAGYSAKTGEVLNIKNAQMDPRFNKDYDIASGYVTKSMLCFPIKNNQGHVIGILQLINSKNGVFSEKDETILAALSIHAAIALQNADLVEKLLQSERIHSLGKMANFLIQDIKKPILVSKRYAEHLLGKNLQPEISQVIQMLLDQINHIVDIVQTTSSYSEGKTVLRTINSSINNTLADYASRIESFVTTKSCKIVNEFDKDVIVKVDLKEFYQCYLHLIKNACDAMPEGGTIYVSTKREDKKVKIFIKDNGLGIPDSVKEKIFDPFFSYGKKEGTGLGLSITKKIIEAHNGLIEFESSTGLGTTFIVTLPIASLF